MPINIKTSVSGSVTFIFRDLDALERLRDCIQDGFNASPRNQLFADDIEEFIEELNEVLTKFGG